MPPQIRPCHGCATPTPNKPAYCNSCGTGTGKTRAARPHYQGDWDKRSKEIRARHLAQYGALCFGYGTPSHMVEPNELTVDHVEARNDTHLQVLCRSCNSRKGNDEKPR